MRFVKMLLVVSEELNMALTLLRLAQFWRKHVRTSKPSSKPQCLGRPDDWLPWYINFLYSRFSTHSPSLWTWKAFSLSSSQQRCQRRTSCSWRWTCTGAQSWYNGLTARQHSSSCPQCCQMPPTPPTRRNARNPPTRRNPRKGWDKIMQHSLAEL